jgi:hypothetical protein
MNKGLNDLSFPINYSLSQELHEKKAKLALIEEKIFWVNDRLDKVSDPELILKLMKKKEECEEEKINLTLVKKKLDWIIGSIKDFILFFIFIRRFYTLAIQKQNFESPDKKISLKLIIKLQNEEKNLYNEYIDGNCFSKVLFNLNFQDYQPYFKKFAKKFFENIQHSNDPYINSLLILKAIFYECMYFHTDNFNLTDLKFFLSKNIPINICLPNSNYELAVLRCFFFYELLYEFLKLKPVKNNFDHLKKAVTLDLKIVNYKANMKDCLLFSLNDLQEDLQKINKKHNEYLEKEAIEDKQADVNHALVFYKILEGEIQAINNKTKDLINNKYVKLEKMQRLLVIIVNESHLPKFLEVFNAKIGNDFLLNALGKSDDIETNKEALNYLFHAICRDEFYTPLNQRITFFINKQIETYSKDDVSILDNIEFEDLIEFSFYYLFTLFYSDFNDSLAGFNNKLLYSEMVTFNVFINFKLQSLEVLEKTKNIRIKKFIERTFKNVTEYNQHKENILEEIKLNLETMQDIKRILSDTKTLETSLLPKLMTSSIPILEKTLLVDSLKSLEQKQKICELEYQKIAKYKFINKTKSEKISKMGQAHHRENLKIDYDKSIDIFFETLCCLSKNLTESLKYIKESTHDNSRSHQKISSAMGQISASIQKLSSSLSHWKNVDEIEDLTKMSLPKLLEMAEKLIIKNDFFDKKEYKKKLTELQKLYACSCSLIEDLINQVNPIINEYRKYNNELEKIFDKSSSFLEEDHSRSLFFSKAMIKKINGNLSNDYIRLKEQSSWLEKLIRLIKCDTDDRVIKLYVIIRQADSYEKACVFLNEKKIIQHGIKEKKSENDDKKFVISHSSQSINEEVEKNPARNLSEEQSEKFQPCKEKSSRSQDANDAELSLITEVLKSTDECNKIRTRFEGEYANKERAKADLKAITSASRYNFLISRIDPLNVDMPITIKNVDNNQSQAEPTCLNAPTSLQMNTLETNLYNHSQPGSVIYTTPAPTMLFPVPPTIVIDTYRLENRTVFYPVIPDRA